MHYMEWTSLLQTLYKGFNCVCLRGPADDEVDYIQKQPNSRAVSILPLKLWFFIALYPLWKPFCMSCSRIYQYNLSCSSLPNHITISILMGIIDRCHGVIWSDYVLVLVIERFIVVFDVLKNMPFTEALSKDRLADLFGDSLELKDLSMSNSLRYSADWFWVKCKSVAMETISLKVCKISAMYCSWVALSSEQTNTLIQALFTAIHEQWKDGTLVIHVASTHLHNSTCRFLNNSMLFHSAALVWLHSCKKEFYSTHLVDYRLQWVLAVGACIQLLSVSPTNFVICKELGHGSYTFIYSCCE